MLADLLGPAGLLAKRLPGYEWRPQQMEMAETVLRSLSEERTAVVEAGTGTGKTFAYLVPAILSGKTVLISTGTKMLQDQIYTRDLPLLEKLLPQRFSAACLKGISNYLCLRRFNATRPDSVEIADWAKSTKTGDRSELSDLSDDDRLWPEISATAETRLGAKCPFYEDCFVTKMRKQASQAQLLIVNHHLFFADLALKSESPQAQVIPPFDAAIFDEAHTLEEVATEHLSVTISPHRLFALGRELRRLDASQAGLADRLDHAYLELAGELSRRLSAAPLPAVASAAKSRLLVGEGDWTSPLVASYHRLDRVLDEIASHNANETADELQALAERTERLRKDLVLQVEQTDRDRVYFAEVEGERTTLRAAPIDLAPHLATYVTAAVPPLVFTSATLSVARSFSFFSERMGLADRIDTTYLELSSPFDYGQQALLYVPRDLPEPNAPSFMEQAAARMQALVDVTAGSALLLFTSHRNLRAAADHFRRANLPYPLLVQGERPRPKLLDALRQQPGSVLLASASFWEGVDVPGDALVLVVIDKLPFAPPDEPIAKARSSRMAAQGRNPFADYQLPSAALTLKQGFGRLIRHRQDRGIVAILDVRMHNRAYGRVFYETLPAGLGRTSSLDEVSTWWRS